MDYIDVAFPIVHGTNVEDGTIAGYLNMLGVPYVGCDILSSALGMDKYAMKMIFADRILTFITIMFPLHIRRPSLARMENR